MIFSNLNAKKLAREVNTFIKDHGSNFSLDNLFVVSFIPSNCSTVSKGMEQGTWNKEQLGEEKTGEMIIKESKRRLVVAVCLQSPLVLHSSPEKVS